MPRYENSATSRAPREVVWAILSDHAGMSRWCRTILRSERIQDGDGALDGVGAVRRLVTPGGLVREVVEVFDPPTRLRYRVLSGLPTVRDYVGEVTLDDLPEGGTSIHWTTEFTVPPLVGKVTAFFIATGTASLARDLARAADERTGV